MTFFAVKRAFGIGFRDDSGHPTEAALETSYGPMRLSLFQVCTSTVKARVHTLHTLSYRYALTAQGSLEPFVRWEYVKNPPGDVRWCRPHLQGPIPLTVSPRELVTLNELHLPTDFVTIEEVLGSASRA